MKRRCKQGRLTLILLTALSFAEQAVRVFPMTTSNSPFQEAFQPTGLARRLSRGSKRVVIDKHLKQQQFDSAQDTYRGDLLGTNNTRNAVWYARSYQNEG